MGVPKDQDNLVVFHKSYRARSRCDVSRILQSHTDKIHVTGAVTTKPVKVRILYDYETRVVAYKDLINTKCLLQILNGEQSDTKWTPKNNTKDSLKRSAKTNHQLLSKQQTWNLGGQKIFEFCRGFPTYFVKLSSVENQDADETYLNVAALEDTMTLKKRKKRSSSHYFRGRIRGQTQSQYLSFGRSDQPGKAEAESTLDGSKAVVSGSSGMGQAQSQSVPIGCDECNGRGYAGPEQEQVIQLGYGVGRPGYETPEQSGRRPDQSGGGFDRPGSGGPGVERGPGEVRFEEPVAGPQGSGYGRPGGITRGPGQIPSSERGGGDITGYGPEGSVTGGAGKIPPGRDRVQITPGGPGNEGTGYGPPERPDGGVGTGGSGQITPGGSEAARPEETGYQRPERPEGVGTEGPGTIPHGGGHGQETPQGGPVGTGYGRPERPTGSGTGGPGQITPGIPEQGTPARPVQVRPDGVGYGGPGVDSGQTTAGRPGEVGPGGGIYGRPEQPVGPGGLVSGGPGQLIPTRPGQPPTGTSGSGGQGYFKPEQAGPSRPGYPGYPPATRPEIPLVRQEDWEKYTQPAGPGQPTHPGDGTFGGQLSGNYQSNLGQTGRFSGQFSGQYGVDQAAYSGYGKLQQPTESLGVGQQSISPQQTGNGHTFVQGPLGQSQQKPTNGLGVPSGPGYTSQYSGQQFPPSSQSGQNGYSQYGAQQYGTGTTGQRGHFHGQFSGQYDATGGAAPNGFTQYGPNTNGLTQQYQPTGTGEYRPSAPSQYGPGGTIQYTPGGTTQYTPGETTQYGPGTGQYRPNGIGQQGPGGTGFQGPGGLNQQGPGGTSQQGPSGTTFQGPGGIPYQRPSGLTQPGPGQTTFQGPGQTTYQGPGQQTFQGPGQQTFQGPGQQTFQGPGQTAFQGPGGLTQAAGGFEGTGGTTFQGQGGAGQQTPTGTSLQGPGGTGYPGPGGLSQPGPGGATLQGPGGINYQGPGRVNQQGPGGIGLEGTGGVSQQGPGGVSQQGPGGMGVQGPSGSGLQGPGGTQYGQGPSYYGQGPSQYGPGGAVQYKPGDTGRYDGTGQYGPNGASQPKPGEGQYATLPSGTGQTPSGGAGGVELAPGQYIRPGSTLPSGSQKLTEDVGGFDDSDSQVQTSVQQVENGTQAQAEAQGTYSGGTAHSQVAGTYSGSGSFSASAGSDDGKRGAQTQVSGGQDGAQSSAQGRGGLGQSQAQVMLSSETGNTMSSAQSSGFSHGTQSKVQASEKGGMANAQANAPGSTSSQAQIGFSPYDENDEDNQTTPFRGGGTAGAQSGSQSGISQAQIQGKFQYGIRYAGGAQAGSGGASLVGNQTFKPGPFKHVNLTSLLTNNEQSQVLSQKKISIPQKANKGVSDSKVSAPMPKPVSDNDENKEYSEENKDYADYYDESTELPSTKSIITQSSDHQKQHIILNPLENLDISVYQSKGDFPSEGTVLQPGETIPGSPGYKIPVGFRGTVKSISNGRNTYAIGKNSQAQSVTISPGSGRVIYKKPVYEVASKTHFRNGRYSYGSGYTYQPVKYLLRNGKVLPNFVSVTKSEAGSTNVYTGRKSPSIYYSQSSSCGVFTNHCVFNGTKRVCSPKLKTNPDGTLMGC
ncbi:hypothetical protein NQ315_000895 [Exocentrus adspersus]|uniref:BRICHOS domain-containing protein n=1 Tax=Exocentrus adspersus TaxID=1586481 RepID=A0AAV8WEU4_9CUCU|nr:hypothetical protein NQ315_000895 [Exocentrus adspersus]